MPLPALIQARSVLPQPMVRRNKKAAQDLLSTFDCRGARAGAIDDMGRTIER
jgi:hypothetical protein